MSCFGRMLYDSYLKDVSSQLVRIGCYKADEICMSDGCKPVSSMGVLVLHTGGYCQEFTLDSCAYNKV